MRSKRLLLLIILFLFSLILSAGDSSPYSFGLCEKGDLIFRTKVGGPFSAHTGIYCDWYETDWNNPSNPINQNIVEAPGREHGVWEMSLDYFYNSGHFWGARVSYPKPDFSQRSNIIGFVRDKAGMYSGKGCPYHLYEGYKGGLVYFPEDDKWYECYRCDGLAEAAYEEAGIDIVNDFSWWSLSPGMQMQATFPASGWEPEIPTTSPEEGDIVEGEVTIMAVVDDGIYGSGLTRAEFFIDGSFLEIDSADAQSVHTYEAEWDASSVSDGSHYIKIVAYDKAGNIGEKRIKVYKGNSPYVISTSPIPGATNVPIDINPISITFSKAMEQGVTTGAVSIDPSVAYTTSWVNEYKTINLHPTDTLDYCREYTVAVTDDAMSEDSIQLDGDGKPDLAVRII